MVQYNREEVLEFLKGKDLPEIQDEYKEEYLISLFKNKAEVFAKTIVEDGKLDLDQIVKKLFNDNKRDHAVEYILEQGVYDFSIDKYVSELSFNDMLDNYIKTAGEF